MSIFDFTSAANPSTGTNFCNPIIASEAEDVVYVDAHDSITDFDSPPRLPSDPAAIAREIFRAEMRDVLKVLHNCGTLHTYDEKLWCLLELAQLLEELYPDEEV